MKPHQRNVSHGKLRSQTGRHKTIRILIFQQI